MAWKLGIIFQLPGQVGLFSVHYVIRNSISVLAGSYSQRKEEDDEEEALTGSSLFVILIEKQPEKIAKGGEAGGTGLKNRFPFECSSAYRAIFGPTPFL